MTTNDIKQELDQAIARLEKAVELARQAGELQQENRIEEANQLLDEADFLLSTPF